MFAVGDKVGDYEIVARLKSGGMATLFLARRLGAAGFAKHVAIKVVHPHLAEDPAFVRMFVDEALLSAKIHHPNVVHVEELREVDQSHFLVMEYVDGCALAQLMRELAKQKRRLTPELAVHVATRVADGLHAAHELTDQEGNSLGVVHRDVSPQNVLLAWQGHVKLIDFGVAKARDRSQQTTGASLKGKIRYMSPEQAYGRPLDRRSDVYALGIVLWEMLTMQRCFRGENDLALIDAVRTPQIPAPSTLVPEVTPELDAAVLKALAPDPDERFATARQLRRALAEALPKALALDSSHLSDLLHAVMGEQVQRARAFLPDSLTGKERTDVELQGDPEEALKTMTLSQADPASFVDFPSDDRPPAQPARRDEPTGPAVIVDPSGERSIDTPSPPEPEPPGTERSSITWAVVGLIVAGVLFVGGALAFMATREQGPVVTPLAEPPGAVSLDAGDSPPVVADPEPPSAADAGVATGAAGEGTGDGETGSGEARAEEGSQTSGDEPSSAKRQAGAAAAERRAEAERRRDERRRERAARREAARMAAMETQGMSGVPLADDFGF